MGLRKSSMLEEADTAIRNEHYTDDRLRIQRLSGQCLSLDQCYINLAIVTGKDANSKDQRNTSSSLLMRQKVEIPDKAVQVELAGIFNPRTASDRKVPRRILIRGRAGIGKTTLCRKIVSDFTRGNQTALKKSWTRLFDRVLWIPLRNLKASPAPKNYEELFFHEFFENRLAIEEGRHFARELELELKRTNSEKTLFILDGLDEVIHDSEHNGNSSLLSGLLKKPNVIITSRPNASLPSDVKLDLELETIGFYPDQVKAYLEKDPDIHQHANEILSFLKKHWLLQGLMRIPIQLDALCFTWKDKDNIHTAPDTMTRIYQEIELKLWRKDAVRIKNMDSESAQGARPGEIEEEFKDEIQFLQILAFNGLYSDVIDFEPWHRDQIAKSLRDKTLAELSFMRTSDQSPTSKSRNYHFIHLTFQEYFAAKYFVQQWKRNDRLLFVFKQPQNRQGRSSNYPVEFLSQYKYLERYDIFWRFVAGLISVEADDTHIQTFFDQLAAEPRDLLGPVHIRLLIHCLSEVSRKHNLPYRSGLERYVCEWILIECNIKSRPYLSRCHLATEAEVPEDSLVRALDEGPVQTKWPLLAAMSGRPIVEASITGLMTKLLEDDNPSVRIAALRAFQNKQGLDSDTVSAIVTRFRDDDDDLVCQEALMVFAHRQNLDPGTVGAIKACLGHDRKTVRSKAVHTLLLWQDLDPDTVSAIATLLGDNEFVHEAATQDFQVVSLFESIDDNWSLYKATARSLYQRQDLDTDTGAAIIAKLRDGNFFIRRATVAALQRQQDPDIVAFIIAQLRDKNPYTRRAAVKAIPFWRDLSPDTVTALTALLLRDKNADTREAALEALACQKVLDPDTITAIIAQLGDNDWSVRHAATRALQHQQNLDPGTVTAITALLRNKNPDTREAAVAALQKRQDLDPDTVSAIAACLRDDHPSVSSSAVKTLQHQQNLGPGIVSAIAALFEDKNPHTRGAAVETLKYQKGLGSEIRHAIVACLKDDIPMVRREAITVVQNWQSLDPDTIRAIAACLRDDESIIRRYTLEILTYQDLDPDTVHTITGCIRGDDSLARRYAFGILRNQDLDPDTVSAIAACLGDDLISGDAIRALQYQKCQNLDIMNTIVPLLENGNSRKAAVDFLQHWDLDPDTMSAIAVFLRDENPDTREAALEVLQYRQDLSSDTVIAIMPHLKSYHQGVRQAAVQALQHRQDLDLDVQPIFSIYKRLVEVSFEEHVYWYFSNGTLHMVFGLKEICFKGQWDQLQEMLCYARGSMGIP